MIRNKNCRGDVPITILVLGVFAVCAVALVSFMNSSIQLNKSFSEIDSLEKANFEIELKSLNDYYDFKEETKLVSFKEGIKFNQKRLIFSIEYFSRGR